MNRQPPKKCYTADQLSQSADRGSRREREAILLVCKTGDVIPKGFRTSLEWGMMWGVGITKSDRTLAELTARKIMEKTRFKVGLKTSKRLNWCSFYRLLP